MPAMSIVICRNEYRCVEIKSMANMDEAEGGRVRHGKGSKWELWPGISNKQPKLPPYIYFVKGGRGEVARRPVITE